MLVPLDTLPRWPDVPRPPLLDMLGLLIGIPAAVFGLIFLLGKSHSLIAAGKPQQASAGEPLWLGGASTGNARAITATATLPALESGRRSGDAVGAGPGDAGATDASSVAATAGVGGASVRW